VVSNCRVGLVADITSFQGIAGATGATIVYPIDLGEYDDWDVIRPCLMLNLGSQGMRDCNSFDPSIHLTSNHYFLADKVGTHLSHQDIVSLISLVKNAKSAGDCGRSAAVQEQLGLCKEHMAVRRFPRLLSWPRTTTSCKHIVARTPGHWAHLNDRELPPRKR
jgi:hypothetical protein